MQKDKLIPITEFYKCMQGEGKYAGRPHLLIRTNGCRLRCCFKDSFCDTPYSSWQPQKNNYVWNDLINFIDNNKDIKYFMITGGGPTLHKDFLIELCEYIKSVDDNNFITIETEGSEYVNTKADFISLSPKLSNSIPVVGRLMPYTRKQITERDKEQHEKFRKNYQAMNELIFEKEYQLKPVISSIEDLKEVKEIQNILDIPNSNVWLMSEGITNEQLQEKRKWLYELALEQGYNYCERLQIIIYGDKRGV